MCMAINSIYEVYTLCGFIACISMYGAGHCIYLVVIV